MSAINSVQLSYNLEKGVHAECITSVFSETMSAINVLLQVTFKWNLH